MNIKNLLSEADFKRRILALVMVQLALMQKRQNCVKVTSIDPIYQFSATEIMKRFYEVDNIIDQVKATPASWCIVHKSPEDLRNNRVRASMNLQRL